MEKEVVQKYTFEWTQPFLTPEQQVVLTIETFKTLGWVVSFTGENGIMGYSRLQENVRREQITVRFLPDRLILSSEYEGKRFRDPGTNEDNIVRFLPAFKEMQRQHSEEFIRDRYAMIRRALVSPEDPQNRITFPEEKTRSSFSIWSVFIPQGNHKITSLIVDLNILIFLVMAFLGAGVFTPVLENMVGWGVNARSLTPHGGEWRLLANCFLHYGVMHLVMNMFALLFIGYILEPRIGARRFVFAYLLSGIAASTLSLAWHTESYSAGASGAIFGMYGLMLALLVTRILKEKLQGPLLISISVYVAYNLLKGLAGPTDNAAHIGGLISGMLIGFSLYPGMKSGEHPVRNAIIAGSTALLFIGLAFVTSLSLERTMTVPPATTVTTTKESAYPNYVAFTSDEIASYDQFTQKFAQLESMALEFYDLGWQVSNKQKQQEIETRGIYYFEECIQLIRHVNTLDLTPAQHHNTDILLKYCKLQIQRYELILEDLEAGYPKNRAAENLCQRKIQLLLYQLKK